MYLLCLNYSSQLISIVDMQQGTDELKGVYQLMMI
jgi:hypothetical protein